MQRPRLALGLGVVFFLTIAEIIVELRMCGHEEYTVVIRCTVCMKVVIAPDCKEHENTYDCFSKSCKCGAVNYCTVNHVLTATKEALRGNSNTDDWLPFKPA